MTIDTIQRLSSTTGTAVVPRLADYADHSPDWTETEYQAQFPGSSSLGGHWEGEPGWVRIPVWPYHEVCVILSGRVAVEDTHGYRAEFGAGEAFVVPAGFDGYWHTLEPTKKIFVGVVPTQTTPD